MAEAEVKKDANKAIKRVNRYLKYGTTNIFKCYWKRIIKLWTKKSY